MATLENNVPCPEVDALLDDLRDGINDLRARVDEEREKRKELAEAFIAYVRESTRELQ